MNQNKTLTKYQGMHSHLEKWFFGKFEDLNATQKIAWEIFQKNKNFLVTSPTGSGKTLSAFLGIFNYLLFNTKEKNTTSITVIYICPLKALVNDMSNNLNRHLEEINEISGRKFIVGNRTGDTSAYNKHKNLISDILCTTPESLTLFLTSSKNIANLNNLKFLIVDEVHAFADNKRGTELAIAIARIKEILPNIKIIGLSATVSPIDQVCSFLFNNSNYEIASAGEEKKTNLTCIIPKKDSFEDLIGAFFLVKQQTLKHIQKNPGCTLIFLNTRSGAESFAKFFIKNDKDLDKIGVHHSSMSKEERLDVEHRLKNGFIKVVISASSLEQGIDISCISQVIQCFSPKSIAKATQRIGRAGHTLKQTTKAKFFALNRCEAIEIGVILRFIKEQKVDNIQIPKNCYDMLVQCIISYCFVNSPTKEELFNFVKTISSYRDLEISEFNLVLNYCLAINREEKTRKYFARIAVNEENRLYSLRGKKKIEFLQNSGSICVDQDLEVKLDDSVIGFIEDNFVMSLKKGDIFSLGGKYFILKGIKGNTVNVKKAPINNNTITPVWHSEALPATFEVCNGISKFRHIIIDSFFRNVAKKDIYKVLLSYCFDPISIEEVFEHLELQYLWTVQHIGYLNYEKEILVECFRNTDNNSIYNVIIHSVFGTRVNSVLVILFNSIFEENAINVSGFASDNGIWLTVGEASIDNLIDILNNLTKYINEDNIYQRIIDRISQTKLFNKYFKQNCKRSLAILKNSNQPSNIPSYILVNLLRKGENNLIFQETQREILFDRMKYEQFLLVVRKILNQELKITITKTISPSPFVHGIMFPNSGVNVDQVFSGKFLNAINQTIHQHLEKETFKLNENITFLKDNALLLNKLDTKYLIFTDLHLGKEFSMLKKYRFSEIETKSKIYEIVGLLNTYKPDKLIILGDIKESIGQAHEEEINLLKDFISSVSQNIKQLILIKGNHDGILAEQLNIPFIKTFDDNNMSIKDDVIVCEQFLLDNIYMHHGHKNLINTDRKYNFIFSGHLHPIVNLVTDNDMKKKQKCFLIAKKEDISYIYLPSTVDFDSGLDIEKITEDKKYDDISYIAYLDNKWISNIKNE